MIYVVGQTQFDYESGDERGVEVYGVFASRAEAEAAIALRPDLDHMAIEEHELGSTLSLLTPGHEYGPRYAATVRREDGAVLRTTPNCCPYVRHPSECEITEYSDDVHVISPISVDHAIEAGRVAVEATKAHS